jgi:predicted ester cyclase
MEEIMKVEPEFPDVNINVGFDGGVRIETKDNFFSIQGRSRDVRRNRPINGQLCLYGRFYRQETEEIDITQSTKVQELASAILQYCQDPKPSPACFFAQTFDLPQRDAIFEAYCKSMYSNAFTYKKVMFGAKQTALTTRYDRTYNTTCIDIELPFTRPPKSATLTPAIATVTDEVYKNKCKQNDSVYQDVPVGLFEAMPKLVAFAKTHLASDSVRARLQFHHNETVRASFVYDDRALQVTFVMNSEMCDETDRNSWPVI